MAAATWLFRLPTVVEFGDGLAEGDIEALVTGSVHPLLQNNPRPVGRDDLWALYRRIL
jgi:hypothetical protein